MKPEDMQKIKSSVPFLAHMWRAYMAGVSGVYQQKPLTPQQFGQLKLLRDALEDITWDVMQWVLENWTLFSQEAKGCAGLPCAPANPHIGFLLAHCQLAVNLVYNIAESTNTVDAAKFVKNVDHMNFERTKEYAVEACEGEPKVLAIIERAKTLKEITKILMRIITW